MAKLRNSNTVKETAALQKYKTNQLNIQHKAANKEKQAQLQAASKTHSDLRLLQLGRMAHKEDLATQKMELQEMDEFQIGVAQLRKTGPCNPPTIEAQQIFKIKNSAAQQQQQIIKINHMNSLKQQLVLLPHSKANLPARQQLQRQIQHYEHSLSIQNKPEPGAPESNDQPTKYWAPVRKQIGNVNVDPLNTVAPPPESLDDNGFATVFSDSNAQNKLVDLLSNCKHEIIIDPKDRIKTPVEMTIELMEHQKIGVDFLMKAEAGVNKGALLADEMGIFN